MKHTFLILIALISISSCQMSKGSILTKTINKMNDVKTVKYNSALTVSEKNQILFSKSNSIFFDLTDSTVNGLKYQFKDEGGELIFNGKEIFQSNNKEKIITTEDNPDAIKPLIATFYPFKHILPKLIDNDKVEIRQVKDTIVQDKKFYKFNFRLKNSNIDWMNLELVNNPKFDTEMILIIDKKNFFPKVIGVQNGEKGFISRTIDDVNFDFKAKEGLWSGANLPTDYAVFEWNDYKERRKRKLKSFIGKSIGSWELPTILGNSSMKISELRGKVVLLEFWFKGCGGCIQAIPELNRIYDMFRNKQFEIYGIEFIDNYSKEALQEYVKDSNMNFPSLYQGKPVAKDFGIRSAPTFLIINRLGQIIQVENGFSEENITKMIKTIEQNL